MSQENIPRLCVLDTDQEQQIYDGRLFRLQRSIADTGISDGALLQALAPND